MKYWAILFCSYLKKGNLIICVEKIFFLNSPNFSIAFYRCLIYFISRYWWPQVRSISISLLWAWQPGAAKKWFGRSWFLSPIRNWNSSRDLSVSFVAFDVTFLRKFLMKMIVFCISLMHRNFFFFFAAIQSLHRRRKRLKTFFVLTLKRWMTFLMSCYWSLHWDFCWILKRANVIL